MPKLTGLEATFGIVTGLVLTRFIAALPNGGSIWVRLVVKVSDAKLGREATVGIAANTLFLSPAVHDLWGTAAAIADEGLGIYLETAYSRGR